MLVLERSWFQCNIKIWIAEQRQFWRQYLTWRYEVFGNAWALALPVLFASRNYSTVTIQLFFHYSRCQVSCVLQIRFAESWFSDGLECMGLKRTSLQLPNVKFALLDWKILRLLPFPPGHLTICCQKPHLEATALYNQIDWEVGPSPF